MAKCKLFESWSFRMKRPAPFDDVAYDGARDFGQSAYNTAGSVHKATLHAPSLYALLAYCKLRTAAERGEEVSGLGALGHQQSNYTMSEFPSSAKMECVVFNHNTGKFIAAQFQDGSDHPMPITVGPGNATGAALLFSLMPQFEADDEFRSSLDSLKLQMENNWPDMDEAFQTALILCDNMYRRVENARNVGTAGIRLSIPATGNVSPIGSLALDNGTYSPTGVLYGEFRYLTLSEGSKSAAPAIPNDDFAGKYALSQRKLSDREESMVPQMPDWYIIPKDVIRICEHANKTTTSSQPMRNFLLRGPAGTGKTMSAQAIAAGLHLPYVMLTCNANTEIGDLIGQFVPETREEREVPQTDGSLPKISDIIMHPPSVYQELTGVYDDSKTEDDVLRKLVEISTERLLYQKEQRGGKIAYVESPLLQAIRYGYLVEAQEPSCITNPGVLVGLNALMDNCQEITLPTGERVKRHPDTVIVATTNAGYEGCRPLNQSILSRMDLIYDTELPTVETMVERVMKITGFTDEAMCAKMALVVREMEDRCHQTMITDGSVGMRELKAWVQSTMVTGDPYESALPTIIGSASADPDNRAELISTCLDAQFARQF